MCVSFLSWASRPGLAAFPVLFASLFDTVAAEAEDLPAQSVSIPGIVVIADRLPTPEEELGSTVTVITADEIERKQERTLPDVLSDVPGLNLVQTGGPGGTTSVFMRGTNANHTKVLINGVDVGDPSSADGSFDFAHILASDIERVEILRGPQSGLYGADAIGGVISITTKKGSGPGHLTGSVEGGSFGTFNQTAGLSGSVARIDYALNFAHFHSDDTPVTPAALVPAGRPLNGDSYDNRTWSTKLGAGLTDTLDVGLTARYVETRLRSTSDDFLGPEASPSDSDNRELFTRGSAHLVLFDGIFEQTLGIGYTDYRRRYLDPNNTPAVPSFDRGNRTKLDWQGNIRLGEGQILTLGAEHQTDRIDDSSPVQAEISNDAGFMQIQSRFGERFFNTVSLRYDGNDRFGGEATWRVAPALLIPETGTKLKGSAGAGYKPPTLDELYDSYPQFGFFANPNLKPEKSVGYDLGFEQNVLLPDDRVGATYFHNKIRDLISINDSFTSYTNIGQATTQGVESFVTVKPWDLLMLRGDFTYTLASDDISHQELLRRPKDKFSLNAHWQVSDAATLSATILYVGSWRDVNRSGSASGLNANGYTVVNLAGSYEITPRLTAFARVDNLLDRRYQDPIGFQHPGIGIFAGLRVSLDRLVGDE
jgi:vitamin B12 transporter